MDNVTPEEEMKFYPFYAYSQTQQYPGFRLHVTLAKEEKQSSNPSRRRGGLRSSLTWRASPTTGRGAKVGLHETCAKRCPWWNRAARQGCCEEAAWDRAVAGIGGSAMGERWQMRRWSWGGVKWGKRWKISATKRCYTLFWDENRRISGIEGMT